MMGFGQANGKTKDIIRQLVDKAKATKSTPKKAGAKKTTPKKASAKKATPKSSAKKVTPARKATPRSNAKRTPIFLSKSPAIRGDTAKKAKRAAYEIMMAELDSRTSGNIVPIALLPL